MDDKKYNYCNEEKRLAEECLKFNPSPKKGEQVDLIKAFKYCFSSDIKL